MEAETIDIMGYEDFEDRGPIGDFIGRAIGLGQLKSNMQEFVKKIESLVDEIPQFTKQYKIDTLEIQLNISASGKVSLLGSGGEVGGSGGIKFVLRKK